MVAGGVAGQIGYSYTWDPHPQQSTHEEATAIIKNWKKKNKNTWVLSKIRAWQGFGPGIQQYE